MDIMDSEKSFKKLQELVVDEDKIVTLPFLADILQIPVQDASKVLKEYVEKHRKENPGELAATYVLTGVRKNGHERAVLMIKEQDLNNEKDFFKSVTSEVLYSVQKSKNVDFNAVATIDWFDTSVADRNVLPGTVVTKNNSVRKLNIKRLPTPPPPTLKGKSSYFMPKLEAKSSEKSQSKSVDKSGAKSTEKFPETNSKSKPTGGIANLFNKVTTSPKKSQKEPPSKTPQKSNGAVKSKNSLSAFLFKGSSSKSSNSASNSSIKSEETITASSNGTSKVQSSEELVMNGEDLEEFMDVSFDESKDKDENKSSDGKREEKEVIKNADKNDGAVSKQDKSDEKTEVKAKSSAGKKNKIKKTNSKRRRDGSEEKETKRRKRIVVLNDSDSDDMFEKDEDIIEASDEEPPRVPSPVKPLAPKNKRRKTVDKTYLDEEGFVVTKTEYVYETPSEDEEPPPPPKPEVEAKPKRILAKKNSNSSENENSTPVPSKGGKKIKKNDIMKNQPTLMNFFSKK